MKRIIVFSILGILSFSFVFTQYDSYENMLDSANNLAEKNIINNHDNNPEKYNLNSYVLRQEIAAVTRGVANLPKKGKCESIFSDVNSTNPNSWACVNIEVLVDNDLISENSHFRPEDFITKAETLGMLIKAIGFDYEYNPNSSKNWRQQIVDFAVQKGVIKRFSDFDARATRGWVFIVADTTMKKEVEERKIEKKRYSDEAL